MIADLKKKLETARQDVRIWKDRYESLQAQTKDFLAALKKAPEAVKNFISRILHLEKKEPEREKKTARTHIGQVMCLTRKNHKKSDGRIPNDADIIRSISIGKSPYFLGSRTEDFFIFRRKFYENRTYQEAKSH